MTMLKNPSHQSLEAPNPEPLIIPAFKLQSQIKNHAMRLSRIA